MHSIQELAGHGIGMYRNTLNTFLHRWFIVLRIDRHFLQLVQSIESVQHPSEQSVLEVQLRLRCVRDEELTGVSSWPIVGHRNHTPFVVLQVLLQFILELPPVNRLTALSGARFVPRLHDEAFNIAVKQAVVVVITGTERQEVLACFWAIVAEQLYFYVPAICVQGDRLERWVVR